MSAIQKLPFRLFVSSLFFMLVIGCSSRGGSMPSSTEMTPPFQPDAAYVIGPGDTLQIFVWRNPEFTATIPVRPDGKISTPLVEDIAAIGKTPTQLARQIEARLSEYLRGPVVTVIVTGFVGARNQQIRIIGEATQPQAIPYTEGMTVLDVMIAVGGLTEFAAGNKSKVVRDTSEGKQEMIVRLEDLLRGGDISANIVMAPGDILIIPQSWF